MISLPPCPRQPVASRFHYAPLMSLCLCGLLLGGCALASRPSTADGVAVEIPARPLAGAFELEGRIAASDGERAANGRVIWQHTAAGDEWTVLTPLGQIAARLTSTPQSAQLITGEGKRLDGPDAQSMLPRILGVSAPVAALPYWVQGIARSNATVLRYDAQNRPARVNDSGWIIDYTAYRDHSPAALPQRLEAHKGEARLRLIIDQWTPLP